MIYVDTSVLLAQLLAEDRRPPAALWLEDLITSRLAEYEVFSRIHASKLTRTHGDAAASLLARLSFLEMSPLVLARALDPFPVAVRTLDALHLASIDYLRTNRISVSLATYDTRMNEAAKRLRVRLHPLGK